MQLHVGFRLNKCVDLRELTDLLTVITTERLQQYIKDFLSRMHVECFIHGNVNKQKVRIS